MALMDPTVRKANELNQMDIPYKCFQGTGYTLFFLHGQIFLNLMNSRIIDVTRTAKFPRSDGQTVKLLFLVRSMLRAGTQRFASS